MMHHRLPLLAQRVLNTPLAIHPEKAAMILHVIGTSFGLAGLNAATVPAEWLGQNDNRSMGVAGSASAYDIVEGVAIVPVEGTLVQKNYSVRPCSGMTGYDGIRDAFEAAMTDTNVRGILLHIDSPGGEVAGSFDLADAIYAARGRKPIWAVLDECAYSAAYAIASAADMVTMPRTGGTGSIGVIGIWTEISGRLKREGITVNIIKHGDRKADGTQFQAMHPQARKSFQAQVDQIGELFIRTVARNREIKRSLVIDMQAGTFHGEDAVAAGLIDMIISPSTAFEYIISTL